MLLTILMQYIRSTKRCLGYRVLWVEHDNEFIKNTGQRITTKSNVTMRTRNRIQIVEISSKENGHCYIIVHFCMCYI